MLIELKPHKDCRVFVNRGIEKRIYLPIKKENKMEAVSKELNINFQSNIKVVKDLCDLLEYKPQSLAEILRMVEILSEFTLYGNQPDVKKDIKRLDDHIKNMKQINKD